eukprot:CAMPEP_0197733730 /NCGR_PEP_ID=MMETSP1434-20131217/44059_1 /TAXON_ID=265543 /ORGANISM="Minutocellus polymorphus, Strain CCMP3303" /LENGTH=289 /DNA_ID=CAMNT_0043321123 /DNA_START=12 /DNA_END=882 /DNA_ORIENTATION=-
MDIVSMALAGRAAEEVFFGDVTTGASDDLRRVTDLVYSTIQLYGMNPNVGQLAFPKDPNAFFDEKPYSAKTAKIMDEQAREIVDKAYERTLNLIREKKSEVESVAKNLLEKETITHDDIFDLIGPRPFKADPAYEESSGEDSRRVTDLVYSTIQLYGMNPNVGQLAFPKDPNAFFDEKPYSAKTAKIMDEQAREIVDKAYERTLNLIREKKAEVESVAKSLLEKETIVHDDIYDLIGPRPFKADPAYEEFIRRRQIDKEAPKDNEDKKSEEEAESNQEDGGAGLAPGIA